MQIMPILFKHDYGSVEQCPCNKFTIKKSTHLDIYAYLTGLLQTCMVEGTSCRCLCGGLAGVLYLKPQVDDNCCMTLLLLTANTKSRPRKWAYKYNQGTFVISWKRFDCDICYFCRVIIKMHTLKQKKIVYSLTGCHKRYSWHILCLHSQNYRQSH